MGLGVRAERVLAIGGRHWDAGRVACGGQDAGRVIGVDGQDAAGTRRGETRLPLLMGLRWRRAVQLASSGRAGLR